MKVKFFVFYAISLFSLSLLMLAVLEASGGSPSSKDSAYRFVLLESIEAFKPAE